MFDWIPAFAGMTPRNMSGISDGLSIKRHP
jgi:hypothetical protein